MAWCFHESYEIKGVRNDTEAFAKGQNMKGISAHQALSAISMMGRQGFFFSQMCKGKMWQKLL